MAYAGQTIHNPLSGERISFCRTAADTDGGLLEFELELAADGRVPGSHVHPEQEALDMEELLCATTQLAHEGNVTRSGMPTPLHLALFVKRFRREVRAPFPPAWIVQTVMAPLAALARRRGHAARYGPAHPATA